VTSIRDGARVWEIAQAARKGINRELYNGEAPRDSTALGEVGDAAILNIRDGACFSIGGAPAIEVVVVLVPTASQHYASVEDTKRALGQPPTRGETIAQELVTLVTRVVGAEFVAKVAAETLAREGDPGEPWP
jgi:hypothetical protein